MSVRDWLSTVGQPVWIISAGVLGTFLAWVQKRKGPLARVRYSRRYKGQDLEEQIEVDLLPNDLLPSPPPNTPVNYVQVLECTEQPHLAPQQQGVRERQGRTAQHTDRRQAPHGHHPQQHGAFPQQQPNIGIPQYRRGSAVQYFGTRQPSYGGPMDLHNSAHARPEWAQQGNDRNNRDGGHF